MNKYTSEFDRMANLNRVLAERSPEFEYVRGFIDMDSDVVVRCKKCHAEVVKSMVTLRRNGPHKCPNCEKQKAESRRATGQMQYAALLFNAGKQTSWKFCGCGRAITSKERVCQACVKRRRNRYDNDKKDKRRIKAYTKETSQINVQSLFARDNGVCWICGEICDMTADVNGNTYPSIDHVLPISKGGKDEWSNVRLAHRICNSLRGNRVDG